MERTLVIDTPKKVGKKVLLQGFVSAVRDHGKITFLDLSDRTSSIQTIVSDLKKDVSFGDIVEIVGTVRRRPPKMVNNRIPTGSVELEADSLICCWDCASNYASFEAWKHKRGIPVSARYAKSRYQNI